MKARTASFFALALVLGVSGCNSKPDSAQAFAHGGLAKLEVLPKAPKETQMSFLGPDGKNHTLADWRGKVVVANFWASWCEPCKEEMPTLGKLAEAYRGKDLAVLPITVDKMSDRDLAQATLAQYVGGKLQLYQAPSYDIAFDEQAEGFPTTIIYSRTGQELARVPGKGDWSSPAAQQLIDWALHRKS